MGLIHVIAHVTSVNRMLLMAVTSMLTGQILKFLIDALRSRRFKLSRLLEPGGMPSSHSAMVSSLATAVGLTHGWNSDLFAVASVFALIVLYDAMSIRRAVGLQAGVINFLLSSGHDETRKPLRERLGHTPLEVLAGAVRGILFTWFFY